jgi:hypothetical protein
MSGSPAEKISSIGLDTKVNGVKSGTILTIDEDGSVWVDFLGNLAGPVKARLTGTMANHLRFVDGFEFPPVMLAFEDNNPGQPLIVDVICDKIQETSLPMTVNRNEMDDVSIDGQTVTFDAKKEIVLRCGKSSITLTRAGKVLIRGAYLLNRSSGVNRIKGGSVQIN